MPKYRVAYAKVDVARFLSQLEVLRTFNRALRRSSLPLAYTQGFNPHPKVSYGPSLSVGMAGLNEYFDLELERPVDVEESVERLNLHLPQGLLVKAMAPLPPFASGLSKVIDCGWYRISLPQRVLSQDTLAHLMELRMMAEPWLKSREKDGKVFDVRRGILELRVDPRKKACILDLLVRVGEGEAPIRVILEAIWEKFFEGIPLSLTSVTRVGLYRFQGEELVTPLGETKGLWEE
ncbi:MAG: TIGR03936 family radical SAM-associated protein [Thermacetogeniaceae bacterium]